MLALCGLLGWEHSTVQPANLARNSSLALLAPGPGAAALWRCVWPWDLHLYHPENYHFLHRLLHQLPNCHNYQLLLYLLHHILNI